MTTTVGLGQRLKTILRWPIDRVLVFWIKLRARIRTFFSPKLLYKDLGSNDLRVLALYLPLTNRHDEPVRCSLHHVCLEHTPEYKAWEEQADPNLRLYKKTRAWLKHYKAKYGDSDTYWRGASRYTWGDYMTLSYSWGSDTRNHWIIVDGQFVPVTESVEAALRSIRAALFSEDSVIRLWVDAICINQENIAERGGEVRRMRKIYGDSMSGFIHLGVASGDSDLGMQSITSIAHSLKEGFDCRTWLLEVSAEVTEGKPSSSQTALVAIMNLFFRQYWSRMWIIQELAMGQDQLVSCGESWASLLDVRQVLKMMVLNMESVVTIISQEVHASNLETYQATTALLWYIGRVRELVLLPDDRGVVKYSSLRSPILNLVQYAYATDPRDKVYGMMGLLPSTLASRIDREDRNYELSTEEVFLNFSKAIIEVTGDLDVIFASSLRQRALSKLELPTWAADWTLRHDRSSGMDDSGDWYFGVEDDHKTVIDPAALSTRGISVNDPARADGSRKGDVRFSSDDRLLLCEGFCIGNIEGMAAEVVGASAISPTPDYVVQPLTGLCPYRDASETASALLRTLLLDPYGEKAKDSTILQLPWFGAEADADAQSGDFNFGDGSTAFFDKLREKGWDPVKFGGSFYSFEFFRRRIGMFQVGGRPVKDYFPQDIPECSGDFDSTTLNAIIANTASRRMVTTRTGYIGLAPANVEPGDEIYVLLGSTMPVLLRPGANNEYFEVVGECYVDGVMKGEAIEWLDAGKYQLQEIILC